jgi:hypothetical protein
MARCFSVPQTVDDIGSGIRASELIADLGSHGFRPGRCATLPQEADPQRRSAPASQRLIAMQPSEERKRGRPGPGKVMPCEKPFLG